MIHHRYEQVQQDDDVYHRVAPKHQHAPETRKNFYAIQFKTIQVDKTENRPEECLRRFPQAANWIEERDCESRAVEY